MSRRMMSEEQALILPCRVCAHEAVLHFMNDYSDPTEPDCFGCWPGYLYAARAEHNDDIRWHHYEPPAMPAWYAEAFDVPRFRYVGASMEAGQ